MHLKSAGVVFEKAFGWMNPNIDFQNPFFTTIQNVSNVVESVDQFASEVLNIQETTEQLGEQREKLLETISNNNDGLGSIVPEHVTTRTAETEAKVDSQSPPITPEDEV
jgi:ribosomal protein S24E